MIIDTVAKANPHSKYFFNCHLLRQIELMRQQLLRYGGFPYGLSMGRVCRPSTENVVTSSYFMMLKQNRGVKLTNSKVWPVCYNLSDNNRG